MDFLRTNAAEFAGAPAVSGLGEPWLDHTGLSNCVAHLSEQFLAAGIGRGDVVVLSIPNGLEAFVVTLAIAAAAVACPIGLDEPVPVVADLLDRLPVKAVVELAGRSTAVGKVGGQRGLPVITASIAGRGTDHTVALAWPSDPGTGGAMAQRSRPDDAALLVRTAGTTGTPKLVAISQASLLLSSRSLAEWLELRQTDRSLCVMPLIHLHSFIRSTLPALAHGGSVVICPGFDPIRILTWITEQKPTFMTAAAGILRTIRLRAAETDWRQVPQTLRLLASGSDSLDAETASSLATMLDVEVREFYGTSETAPMIAASRKHVVARARSSIGPISAPWLIAAFDEAGVRLPPGSEGEIGVKGGLVNPTIDANGSAGSRVRNGWFLTGDRGWVDPDGDLHILGRVDERLNRGGKKIGPEAIEAVLLGHSAVRQCVVFPIPDALLGERVGAIVVPVAGECPIERHLRSFARTALPEYMVPERILIADSLPMSATGKVTRRGLADLLADRLAIPPERPPPRFVPANETEATIARLVTTTLDKTDIDLEAEFAELGGNSFLALELLISIEQEFGRQLSPDEFTADQSVAGLARMIDLQRVHAAARRIVQVRHGADGPPLFVAHGVNGNVGYFWSALAHLAPTIPVYGLLWERARSLAMPSMEDHASDFVAAIREIQPSGPYHLAGYSFAAHLAVEIAQQLFAAGEPVAFLGILDDSADLARRGFGARNLIARDDTTEQCRAMLRNYVPQIYPGDLWLYAALDNPMDELPDPYLGWRDLACGSVHRRPFPVDHATMMSEDRVHLWAPRLSDDLLSVRAATTGPFASSAMAIAAERRARTDVAAIAEARTAAKEGWRSTEIAHYRRAIAFQEAQPYWVYRNLAEALTDAGELEAALAAYRSAAEREANPIYGLCLVSQSLRRLGRHDQATDALDKAEACAGDDLLSGRALVHIAHLRRSKDDVETRLRSLTARFADKWAYAGLCDALAESGRLEEARLIAEEACAAHPTDQGLKNRLARYRG